ncbi:MAG: hypothetical protein JNK04_09575 [Myxococcales bacterium]|nr:hypothetical protein [Myxococcales bacterium]
MKLKSVAPEVMKVFTTAQFKSPKVGAIKTDITSAVLAVVGQAQEDELVKMLGARMSSQDQEGYKNQAFWQTVSARALGELTSEKAVRPLIKVLLTPEKSPIANTALVALVKIGRPSIAAAESLLRSEDADLVAYAKQEAPLGKGKGHVGVAAQILGALGNGSSAKPLIAAIEQASDDAQTKAVIALTLTQLPRSATTIAAFKSVFDEMKYDTETPAGPAKEAMANAAAELFDPTLASHLVKATTDADSKKGPAANVDAARVAALSTAIKLMDIEQVAEVEGLAKTKTSDSSGGPKTVGATLEKELVQAKELAKSCNGEVKCYLAALTNDENQKREKQLIAIKAAYMVGALGRESDRQQLLVALPKISNEAARIAALKALLALAPRGDAAAADELTKLYVEAEQTKNEALMASYRLFLQTAAQLRLRAQ